MLVLVSDWALLVGAVMPIAVGIITKQVAQPAIKATALLLLDAVGGLLIQWLTTPEGFDLRSAVVTAVVTLITSVGTYYGWIKHTIGPVINAKTARFGIGNSSTGIRAV